MRSRAASAAAHTGHTPSMNRGALRCVFAQLSIKTGSAINRAFADWGEVFPNAACVVSLIDRLMHRAEVVRIDGDSYRAKEAEERQAQRTAERAKAAAARPRKGSK